MTHIPLLVGFSAWLTHFWPISVFAFSWLQYKRSVRPAVNDSLILDLWTGMERPEEPQCPVRNEGEITGVGWVTCSVFPTVALQLWWVAKSHDMLDTT